MNINNNIKNPKNLKCGYVKLIVAQAIERSESQTCLNAYALTVVFKNRNSFTGKHSISELKAINRRFRKLYIALCKFQFRDRMSRKWDYQAQIHSFIDVAGTKYGKKSIENIGDNPHIHAVIIPHISHAKSWSQNKYLDDVRKLFASDTLVESVALDQIDNVDGLKQYTRYASKYYVPYASSQQYSHELYRIYPEPKN